MNQFRFFPDTMNNIVDSHCHLDFLDFKKDLDEVLKRAQKKNVNFFLNFLALSLSFIFFSFFLNDVTLFRSYLYIQRTHQMILQRHSIQNLIFLSTSSTLIMFFPLSSMKVRQQLNGFVSAHSHTLSLLPSTDDFQFKKTNKINIFIDVKLQHFFKNYSLILIIKTNFKNNW